MKKIILAVCLSVIALPAQKVFAEHVIESGTDKVKINIYGQVNRAIMYVDDGENSDTYFVDNSHSSTRLGIKGSVAANDEFSAGLKFETEYRSNASSVINHDDESISDGKFKERHMDIFLATKTYGKFSLGQGDSASNGSSEVDLSGTTLAGYSDISNMGGSFEFFVGSTSSTTAIKDVTNNMDGLSRRDRVRYDSPSFAGLRVSGSVTEKSGQDISLRYSKKFGVLKVSAAAAYSDPGANDDSVDNTVNGSISALMDNGLNLTVAAGKQELDNPAAGVEDPQYFYVKVGYQAKLFEVGSTSFSFDYANHEDVKDGYEADIWGVQVVQALKAWGSEIYAGFRNNEIDDDTITDFDDIKVVMSGVRVKF